MAIKIMTIDSSEQREFIESAIAVNVSELKEALLANIIKKGPYFLEGLVGDLLEKMGYGKGQVTKKSGDNGIDVIMKDELGLFKIGVQVKCYTDKKVGGPDIQKLIGALARLKTKKGIMVTTSLFTSEAVRGIEYSDYEIVLIDGNYLLDLLIKYNVGVVNEAIYILKAIDQSTFR